MSISKDSASEVPVDSPAIQVKNLSKSFKFGNNPFQMKHKKALDQISFDVPRGQIFGFLGPNGAGKTTLIKILAGLLHADHGSCALFDSKEKRFECRERDARLHLGYLPERPYYHDFLTTEEFLEFHGGLLGLSKEHVQSRIPQILRKVGLHAALDQKLRTFSKGMLQRIGFAQALLHNPEILVLDEPMSGLDPVGRREVRDLITETAESGKTVFFSTHIIHDVEVICDSVGFIHNGKLKGLGGIESLLGKTMTSMEVRFSFPKSKDPLASLAVPNIKKTMEGYAVEVESSAETLETEVNTLLSRILHEKGQIKAVVPRKSTLEDLFFGENK